LPTKDEHIRKALGNETFAFSLSLDSSPRIDWALISLFYSAMHYVEAYMDAMHSQHIRSHETRDQMIGKESNLKRIYNEYCDLKYFGFEARYEVSDFTASDFRDDARPCFDRLKTYISKFL
jgi:hypothetical protein